ncbi:MAG: GNAT family N-acetyltransferase [candidate division KSB1 bacterium]|nr:GNAT family N-acetyltransferase [candidate division KSB1 bacterium]
MTKKKIVIYYLEMTHPSELRPKRLNNPNLKIEEVKIPCPEFNRFLYTAVGGDWFWIDRLGWSYQQWYEYLNRPELKTWVAYLSGTPCGYFELEMQPDLNVKLVYLGLLPQFIGQGLGGHLLTEAVERAWQMGASRVWVHTCSLDHPGALKNYQARGFKIYKEVEMYKELPAETPGPWLGARRKKFQNVSSNSVRQDAGTTTIDAMRQQV